MKLGLVPGAATFEMRFGFVSAWLPLTAPLDAGVLAGRAAGLMSGLLLLLLLGLWLDAARTPRANPPWTAGGARSCSSLPR